MAFIYYPTFNNPKIINIEDFIPPVQMIETFNGGLTIQENKIVPSYPIYINYNYYNWDWTENDTTGNTPNKWFWIDVNNSPILDSAGKTFEEASKLGDPKEVYAPIRLWMASPITENIIATPGVGENQRDNTKYNGTKAHDLTFYKKPGMPVLGEITAQRNPHQIEYYIKDNIIHTNFDFDSNLEIRSSIMLSYETITKNIKLKIIMRTNEPNKTSITPTVDTYVLKLGSQQYTRERLT